MISMGSPVLTISQKSNSQIINDDPSGRTRVSQLTTLFDGKTITTDDDSIWDNQGTGTFTFVDNKINMSVGVGQYCIRQSRYRTPYSSGKPQFIETTLDNFTSVSGVIKRCGYFSSGIVVPYDSEYDGVWLENDAGNISLKASNKGTLTMDIPITSWLNYESLKDYDWSNFTVIAFDFLWLGGTSLRLFIKTNKGFELAHEEHWASNFKGTFINSPNQYVRYEIRSTTGNDNLNAICSQVATEGSINSIGKSVGIYTSEGMSANSIGTLYAIKSVRLSQSFRECSAQLTDVSVTNTSGNDAGLILVMVNPITSSPATYTSNSILEGGVYPSGTTVTPDSNKVLATSPSGRFGLAEGLADNLLSYLGDNIQGVPSEYVLVYMPVTTNQTVYGTITVKEY